MLRYTTIHHDVRDSFKLTLSEYIMCDSYHQLSHQFPTTKTPEEIGKFNGVGRTTAFDARAVLIEKGLLVEIGGGWKTTDKWHNAVTFAQSADEEKVRKSDSVRKADSKSENRTDIQYIINKDITSEQSSRGEIVTTDDITVEVEEDLVPTKNLRKKGLPKSVEADIQKMWAFWPGPHGAWRVNKTIREYSEVLLKERGLEKVQWAVEFWLDNKHDKFCPDISTPHLLASKYESLQEYRRKKLGY